MWNDTVHASDIIYHLGDFSFYKDGWKAVEILKKLKGNKVLLKGNHDHSDNFGMYGIPNGCKTYEYLEKKFTVNSLTETKVNVCMFHFPIGSWHRQNRGAWMLHGHSHGAYTQGQGRILDVGIDNAYNLYGEHKFFDLEMIESYMASREIYIADAHRDNKMEL